MDNIYYLCINALGYPTLDQGYKPWFLGYLCSIKYLAALIRAWCFVTDSLLLLLLISIQQRPAEMEWIQPRCIGDIPNRRSGHSFTMVKGGMAYIFAGEVHT